MSDFTRARRLITHIAGGVVVVLVGILTSRVAVGSLLIDGNAATPISGEVMVPLDVRFTNGYDFPISVTDLRVRVLAVRAPHADRKHLCTAGDFVVSQVSSTTRIRVDARTTSSLSSLHLPGTTWPRVGIVSGSADKKACRGASLTLDYTASKSLRLS